MNRRVGTLVLLMSSLVVVSGCLDDSGPPGDPELVAENAIKTFGASAGSQDGGDIKRISGSFNVANTEPDENGFTMLRGDGALEMSFEWGKDDVVHVTMAMASGGMTFTVEAWCTPSGKLLKWGDDVYESRPSADNAGSDDICGDTEEAQMTSQGLDMFSDETFEGIELRTLDTDDDGTITATFDSPEDNSTITATIDAKGRVTRIAMDGPEGNGAFDISYGKRDSIAVPEANERLPADVEWASDLEGTRLTATITSSPQLPAREEMQARLILRDWEKDETKVVASFPAEVSGVQTKDGYSFEYEDLDGDGRVSENDTFTFSYAGWEGQPWTDEDLDLFDEWAGVSVNDSPLPAPGLVPLLSLGLLGLVLVARRRTA